MAGDRHGRTVNGLVRRMARLREEFGGLTDSTAPKVASVLWLAARLWLGTTDGSA